MQAKLIDIGSLEDGELAAWRELAARALEPNPFFEVDFVIPSARHLGSDGAGLLVVEQGGEWRACLPVVSGRWRGPLRATRPWRHMYSFLGLPLLAGHDPAPLQALLGAAERSLVALEWVTTTGPTAAALERAVEDCGLVRAGEMSFERAFLRRDHAAGLLERLPPKRRHELERQRRRLEDLLDAPLECIERSGDPDAVEQFLHLEAEGWKGREGTALLGRPGHGEFFREVCARFAADERLRLYELRAGERTVALKCNLLAAPGLFMFKIAHDEELGRFSPGVHLELENVEKFLESDLQWMDSCADPHNQMINRLWPDRRELTTIVLARGGLRGRASRAGLTAIAAIRQRREPSTAT